MSDLTAHEASEEAIHKAKNAQQAVEFARELQQKEQLVSQREMMEEAVIAALNRGAADKKYVDISRIPFICDDIRGIHKTQAEIKDMLSSFPVVKLIVFSFVGAILLGVLGVAGKAILTSLHTLP